MAHVFGVTHLLLIKFVLGQEEGALLLSLGSFNLLLMLQVFHFNLGLSLNLLLLDFALLEILLVKILGLSELVLLLVLLLISLLLVSLEEGSVLVSRLLALDLVGCLRLHHLVFHLLELLIVLLFALS